MFLTNQTKHRISLNNKRNRLKVSMEYIEANFERPLSLQEIADTVFMSKAHFLRQFKKYFDITPHQYLTQCRLRAARYLLQHSDVSITEIVYASGFKNRSSFSRMFKQHCGCSPLEYRTNRQAVYDENIEKELKQA